jgi:hypothetical protein
MIAYKAREDNVKIAENTINDDPSTLKTIWDTLETFPLEISQGVDP